MEVNTTNVFTQKEKGCIENESHRIILLTQLDAFTTFYFQFCDYIYLVMCGLGRTATGLWTQSQPERMSVHRALPVIHTLKGYHPNLQGPLPTHQSFPTGPLPRTDQPCMQSGHRGYSAARPLLLCPLYPYQYPYPLLKPQHNVFQGLSVTLPFKSCHSSECVCVCLWGRGRPQCVVLSHCLLFQDGFFYFYSWLEQFFDSLLKNFNGNI